MDTCSCRGRREVGYDRCRADRRTRLHERQPAARGRRVLLIVRRVRQPAQDRVCLVRARRQRFQRLLTLYAGTGRLTAEWVHVSDG